MTSKKHRRRENSSLPFPLWGGALDGAVQYRPAGRGCSSRRPPGVGLELGQLALPSCPMVPIFERVNRQLAKLAVYEPGKPIEETARELNVEPGEIIKLASNENPLGPSPKAVAAMREALQSTQLYPDGSGFYLRNAIADRLGLSTGNVILGNGSNEVIEFAAHAFLSPGDEVIAPKYAFICYKLIAQLFGAQAIETPALDFRADLEAILQAITQKTKIVFIANPNNPTGTLIAQSAIDHFIERMPDDILVVVDEAYFEFLNDPPDTLHHVREGRNVLVLRTFSKIYGLAGLRVGYGIARSELIEVLQKTRQPFNVNGLAQAAALAALDDSDYLDETRRIVNDGRIFLEQEFAKMKLRFVPSFGNFVFAQVGDGPAIFKKMLARKIIVRPLVGYDLPEWIRITVGTMEQNQKCIAALKEVLA